MSHYQVIVGNIGTVYEGESLSEAWKNYEEYRDQSRLNQGLAGGEEVTILRNGDQVYSNFDNTWNLKL